MTTQETTFHCIETECGKRFKVVPQELKLYKQKSLPLPQHCPSCRHRHRMALRAERALYKRKCGKCNCSILSVYPESAPYIIYCQDCFWKNIG